MRNVRSRGCRVSTLKIILGSRLRGTSLVTSRSMSFLVAGLEAVVCVLATTLFATEHGAIQAVGLGVAVLAGTIALLSVLTAWAAFED